MGLPGHIECYTDEWKRTEPDFVVFLPPGQKSDCGDNEHFLVTVTPKGELLAFWTQAETEASANAHFICSRSSDGGHTWTDPQEIDGPESRNQVAVYGIPVVSDAGRIYCFYNKHLDGSFDRYVRVRACHLMCRVSDDDGYTWSPAHKIPFRRTRYDSPNPSEPSRWIIWQKPIRDSRRRWLTSFTRCAHPALNRPEEDTRCEFIRFENLNEGVDPQDIELTFLPEDEKGLTVPHPINPAFSRSWEASLVLLPDGRLFTAMSTKTGSLYYSVSEDDGLTWRATMPLRYQDDGERVLHPSSPGPLYELQDQPGRYLLLYHNNDGSMSEGMRPGPVDLNRRSAFIAVGEYRPRAVQPVWFSRPKKLADTDGVIAGPQQYVDCCTYTSMTQHRGQRVLWYPDRKHFLLGKLITDEWLADRVVAEDQNRRQRPRGQKGISV